MRNKENRNEWAKDKYKRFVADIDKPIADKFQAKLKKKKLTFQGWLKEKIEQFLGE